MLSLSPAVLGDNFLKYMEAFKPFLAIGLKNHEEHQVCRRHFLVVTLARCSLVLVRHRISFYQKQYSEPES